MRVGKFSTKEYKSLKCELRVMANAISQYEGYEATTATTNHGFTITLLKNGTKVAEIEFMRKKMLLISDLCDFLNGIQNLPITCGKYMTMFIDKMDDDNFNDPFLVYLP